MKNKLPLYLLSLLAVLIVFNSCKKEYETIQNTDDAKIQAYISKNNISMTKDASGFYYQILSPGSGGAMANADSVFFDVTVKSLDGKIYYAPKAMSNIGEYLGYMASPRVFKNGIKDIPYPGTVFQTALSKIKRGGKLRLAIPSYLAFGKNGNEVIGNNEILIMEISVYDEITQSAIDEARIQAFISANAIPAVKQPSGIYTQIITPGTGSVPIQLGTLIEVKYTGKLLTGEIFDQTAAAATSKQLLYYYIRGWQKGLVGLTSGTKIKLIIPSSLAYSWAALEKIPQNSVLNFDVEIVAVDPQ